MLAQMNIDCSKNMAATWHYISKRLVTNKMLSKSFFISRALCKTATNFITEASEATFKLST